MPEIAGPHTAPRGRATRRGPARSVSDVRHAQLLRAAAHPSAGALRHGGPGAIVGDALQTFGLEIEFEGGDPEAVARELVELGLATVPTQADYHSHERVRGKWIVERDDSVTGEVVSPVLTDTPETWRDIATVCAVIERHGGRATTATGGHVNVGVTSSHLGPVSLARVAQLTERHEDVLFRLAGTVGPNHAHRGVAIGYGGYQPLSAASIDPLNRRTDQLRRVTVQSVAVHGLSKAAALNLQPAITGPRSGRRVELRLMDGSLDPAVWQLNVTLACALARAASRRPMGIEVTGHEVGTARRRRAGKRRDAQQVRELADDLSLNEAQRLAVYARFLSTAWQPAPASPGRRQREHLTIQRLARRVARQLTGEFAIAQGRPATREERQQFQQALCWGVAPTGTPPAILEAVAQWGGVPLVPGSMPGLTPAVAATWERFREFGMHLSTLHQPRELGGIAAIATYQRLHGAAPTQAESEWLSNRALAGSAMFRAAPTEAAAAAYRQWRTEPLPPTSEEVAAAWSADLAGGDALERIVALEIARLTRRFVRSQTRQPSAEESAWIEERVLGAWPWNPSPSAEVTELIAGWSRERHARIWPGGTLTHWMGLLDHRWIEELSKAPA